MAAEFCWTNDGTLTTDETSVENNLEQQETIQVATTANEEEVVELLEEKPDVVPLSDEDLVYIAAVEQVDGATEQAPIVQESVSDPLYMELEVTQEEIITENWDVSCGQDEIVIGTTESIICQSTSGDNNDDNVDIPLPTDQDEYTAARPYPCDFCSRRFRKKANLMNHMVAHQTDRPHGCNLCGVRYIRKCDLMNHLKVHAYIPETDGLDEEDMQFLDDDDDTAPDQQQQTRSRKKANKNDMDAPGTSTVRMKKRYPITDPRKPFVCQHCGVGFAREKALESHARIHAGDSPFECRKCGEMYWDANVLRNHLRVKHHQNGTEMEEGYSEDDEDVLDTVGRPIKYGTFYCPTCGLSFHREDNLRRHQRIHIKEEYVNDHEFGHVCNVCGETFPEALDLLAHAEIHARTIDFRCMNCGEVCEDEQAVAAHVQAKHSKNLPPNSCLLCGRTCKDRRTLLKHSWEHSKTKSLVCTKCSKSFHNKARLKRHMLTHRNKIVACDVCNEEFPDGRSLLNHRHSHNAVTSGRQFPCRECGKTFGSRSSQQIHIRIHTGERPYGCRFCWKAFADGGTLRKHERIHTGEKPYACAVCPRAFNQRVVLREHIRSHHSGPDPKHCSSMTPYCCAVCSDMFAASQDLVIHLIHHCDLNTAMRRQPQIGPRKYKRRRKLKPHELEILTLKTSEPPQKAMVNDEDDVLDDDDEEEQSKKKNHNPYSELYESPASISENNKCGTKIVPITAATTTVIRPKMIHTQKTRVPVLDGQLRHKTKTMVTPVRPRTKNVSYRVLHPDKLQPATFSDVDATQEAVNNLLKDEGMDSNSTPSVVSDEVIKVQPVVVPSAVSTPQIIKITGADNKKMVRIVRGGMIIAKGKEMIKIQPQKKIVTATVVLTNNINNNDEKNTNNNNKKLAKIKEDPSALHELAEISMQHANAQNNLVLFKCEMCSAQFTDRAKLLDHVPIHI